MIPPGPKATPVGSSNSPGPDPLDPNWKANAGGSEPIAGGSAGGSAGGGQGVGKTGVGKTGGGGWNTWTRWL